MCVIDHSLSLNVCIETHVRLPDNAQSAEACAKFQQNKGTDTSRIYCNIEQEGPNYAITCDFDHNTKKYKLIPPSGK